MDREIVLRNFLASKGITPDAGFEVALWGPGHSGEVEVTCKLNGRWHSEDVGLLEDFVDFIIADVERMLH